jgi:hypothetical protein
MLQAAKEISSMRILTHLAAVLTFKLLIVCASRACLVSKGKNHKRRLYVCVERSHIQNLVDLHIDPLPSPFGVLSYDRMKNP